MDKLEIEWIELEALCDQFTEAQSSYFSARAKYYARIRTIKKLSKHSMSWKMFSTKVRSQMRKIRNEMNVPKGYSVDHKISVLRCFLEGWSVESTNAKSNLQILPKRDNMKKAVKCDWS